MLVHLSPLQKLRNALLFLWRAIDGLMALILLGMIAIVSANVVLRYGFSSGIREAIELISDKPCMAGHAGRCRRFAAE